MISPALRIEGCRLAVAAVHPDLIGDARRDEILRYVALFLSILEDDPTEPDENESTYPKMGNA